MASKNRTSTSKRASWDFAALASRANRVDLIEKFNQVSGPHSSPISRLQEEFIEGKLDPDESIALAKVFLGLIDAAARAKE